MKKFEAGKSVAVTSEISGRNEWHHPIGVSDAKGRWIGAQVAVHTETVSIIPADKVPVYSALSHPENAGLWYYANVRATRDGVIYGAYHRGGEFRTITERDAYIERRLQDSRKYALKKFT